MTLFTNKKNWFSSHLNISVIAVIAIILLSIIPLFYKLSELSIRIYDEGRLAINAYEMYKNGNFITTYYNGLPEMWNTKPPLLIWLQTLGLHIFGVNEFALRLPIALASLFTAIFIFYFSSKKLVSTYAGFIASVVLITSFGFVNFHASRTGDYDNLVTLFMIIGAFSYFSFLNTWNNRELYIFFIAISLGVLTKSITALLLGPSLLAFTLIEKKLPKLLYNKHLYLGILVFIIPVFSYYFAREYQNPGYINAVVENELTGRYLQTIENHSHGFSFYFDMMRMHHYSEWFYISLASMVLGFFNQNKTIRKFHLFLVINSISFFLIISFAQTKLEWYNIPLYPLLATIIGISFQTIIQRANQVINHKHHTISNFAFAILTVAVLYTPYQKVFNRWLNPKEFSWDISNYEFAYYLKSVISKTQNIENHTIVYDDYLPNIEFYIHALNEQGQKAERRSMEEIKVGDKIITFQAKVKEYIENKFTTTIVEQGNINKYNIISIK